MILNIEWNLRVLESLEQNLIYRIKWDSKCEIAWKVS